VLRAETAEEKGRLLEETGGPGKVEQDIVDRRSKVKPLWQPGRFAEAHRVARRSRELLDRNGVRGAPMPPQQLGAAEPGRRLRRRARVGPPRDKSYQFALIAIVLLVLAALGIPIIVSAVV
jgi:hypothetical protein